MDGCDDIVEQWFEKAAEDLQSAEVLLGAGIISNSCYHAQQAGEKALKAYLSLCVDEVPKTHNLGELCKLCIDFDEDFTAILRISSSLTAFATHTRYPGAAAYTEEDAEEALQGAGRIFIFTQERIALLELDNQSEQSGPTMSI